VKENGGTNTACESFKDLCGCYLSPSISITYIHIYTCMNIDYIQTSISTSHSFHSLHYSLNHSSLTCTHLPSISHTQSLHHSFPHSFNDSLTHTHTHTRTHTHTHTPKLSASLTHFPRSPSLTHTLTSKYFL